MMTGYNVRLTLLPTVQELASVGALDSWHELLVDLVGAGIVEVHLGKGSTPTRVVNDVLNDTLHEADALAPLHLEGHVPEQRLVLAGAVAVREALRLEEVERLPPAAIAEPQGRAGDRARVSEGGWHVRGATWQNSD